MKPKFILSPGIGWSGTTSLYYTLKNIKYVHTGRHKEPGTLFSYFGEFLDGYELDRYDTYLKALNYSNTSKDNILNEKEVNELYGPAKSFEKYIRYYKNLYEKIKEDYQAVGDFSNNSMALSKNDLTEISNKLTEYFDVKVLISLRDPIRRTWSNAGSYTNLNETRYFSWTKKYYVSSLETDMIDNFEYLCNMEYVKSINKFYDAFGKENVCYLIMEDLYDPNNSKEKEKLENFLNINIDEMYPCVYVPDKGINSPKIDPKLRDQWDSDQEILTPEIYNTYRNNEYFTRIYSEFEKLHGYLPADWGSPIDYGY